MADLKKGVQYIFDGLDKNGKAKFKEAGGEDVRRKTHLGHFFNVPKGPFEFNAKRKAIHEKVRSEIQKGKDRKGGARPVKGYGRSHLRAPGEK